jgi:phosphate uptake regulator
MESRKVQAVGTSTLAISLPKKWASEQHIEKGARVFLVEEGDVLKVLSPSVIEGKKNDKVLTYVINADLCKEPDMLERIIVGNYVLGRERLIVKSDGRLRSDQHQEVRNVAWRLIGLGIIEETSDRMILQCSIDPTRYPLEELMKRLYNIGATMFDEAIESLLTKNASLAEDVLKREDDADMIYWLCLRLILSAQADDSLMEAIGVKRRFELAGNRLIIKDLESVADHCEEIAKTVLELIKNNGTVPSKLSRSIKDYYSGVKELYEKTLMALLQRDLESANKALKLMEDVKKKEARIGRLVLEEAKNPQNLLSLRIIIYNIQKIMGYAKSISIIAINRYLESPSKLCNSLDE